MALTTSPPRDRYVDGLRAFSLLVVVAWHWIFTVITWHRGPHTGNPIGTTPGMWALTWVLQVMPLFFWVGGFAHLRTWESVERALPVDAGRYRAFLHRRLARLLRPAAACVGLAAIGRVLAGVLLPHNTWLTSALLVILSPLWFLGVYLGLVLVAPLAIAAHRRWGVAVPIALGLAAGVVDGARFHSHVPLVGWLNFALVWAFAHQLGFFYPRLVRAHRRVGAWFAAGGLAGLIGLTTTGLYPRSMVGVPGQRFSNMGPPTLCIVALCLLQVGVATQARPAVSAWLERAPARRLTDWMSTHSMTVFLWHFVGFAAAYALLWVAGLRAPQSPSTLWWAERPLYVIAPALATAPFIAGFARLDRALR